MIFATKKPLAVITGATRGIGKAVALELASRGYIVALLARSKAKLNETATLINNNCGIAIAYEVDVANYKQVDQALKKIIAQFKRIDVLFNNAGIFLPGSENLLPKDIDALIDINLKGAIYLAHKVIPVMKKQKSGYIFNLSSRAGIEGFSGLGLYCASKFGLRGYSESLFNELIKFGINVTAICPCFVNTDMPQGFSQKEKEMMIPVNEIVRNVCNLLDMDKRALIKELVIYCRASLDGRL